MAEPGRPWRPGPGGVLLGLRVTPRGGRDRIEGVAEIDGRPLLRVRVAPPPAEGAANAAVIRLIAKSLGLPPSAVAIAAGGSGRIKTLSIAGDAGTIAARLERLTRG